MTRLDAADDACSATARAFATTRATAGFFFEAAGFFDFDFDFDGLAGAFFIRES